MGSYVVSRARTWLRCDSIIDSIMAFFGLRILVNVLSVFSIPMLLLMTVVYGFSVPVLFKHFGRQIDQVVCPVLETVRGFYRLPAPKDEHFASCQARVKSKHNLTPLASQQGSQPFCARVVCIVFARALCVVR